MIFYHTNLQGGKFIAVASFDDGDRITYNLDAGEARLRPALVAICQQHAEDLAKAKEVSLG